MLCHENQFLFLSQHRLSGQILCLTMDITPDSVSKETWKTGWGKLPKWKQGGPRISAKAGGQPVSFSSEKITSGSYKEIVLARSIWGYTVRGQKSSASWQKISQTLIQATLFGVDKTDSRKSQHGVQMTIPVLSSRKKLPLL